MRRIATRRYRSTELELGVAWDVTEIKTADYILMRAVVKTAEKYCSESIPDCVPVAPGSLAGRVRAFNAKPRSKP